MNTKRQLDPLPVDVCLPDLLAALGERGRAVLEAPTGAGKTTRVPPALEAAGLAGGRKVVVLEPRRVAARAAARRIADEQGWTVGREVGWRIRLDRREGPETRLLFATEGVLVRMLQADPFLEDVGAVVFDEVHERSLPADLALAMTRRVRREARPDLVLLAMSATPETGRLAAYLDEAPVLVSRGRLHPVEVEHLERPDDRRLPELVAAGVRRMLRAVDGDVLAFLPGVGEIRRTESALADLRPAGVDVVPLYGDLSPEDQDRALRRGPRRRVVLATDVAETSVTVEGVEGVVDGGWARRPRFDPGSGLDRLELVRISRAAAAQRTGRAGRLGPGRCLRLWTEHDERSFRDHETPEVRRVDPTGALLELLAWGESDPLAFPWLDPPDHAAAEHGLELLRDLGARDRDGRLTPLGRALAGIPAHPRLARVVLEGHRLGVGRRAALAAAVLADRDPVRRPGPDEQPTVSPSDLLDRVEAAERPGAGGLAVHRGRAARARQVGERLLDEVRRAVAAEPAALAGRDAESAAGPGPTEAFLRAVLAGYPDRVARRREGERERFVLVGGRGARLGRWSAVRESDLLVAVQVDGGRGAEARIDLASGIREEWLPPDEIRTVEDAFLDAATGRARGRRRRLYRDLVLEELEVPASPEAAAAVLCDAALADPETALGLADEPVRTLLARLRFLARERPELGLEVPGPATWERLVPGLVGGSRSLGELRRLDLGAILEGLLSSAQRASLRDDAPLRLEVPTGSSITLDWGDGSGPPVLAVAIQELFGLGVTPRVAGDRVPVLLHLLAPNRRPEQITRDLAHFWREVYPQVRRELRGRYPRHPWPEDPLSAPACRPGRPRQR